MQLNNDQIKAIKQTNGIELVIAGAGTGKTRLLIEKVKTIIDNAKYQPEQILILTFSKRASLEIKERLINRIGNRGNEIFIGTFHSFCYMLMKNYSKDYLDEFNFKKVPRIIDEKSQALLLEKIIKSELHNLKGFPYSLIYNIITLNNKLLSNIKQRDKNLFNTINKIINFYANYKIKNNLVDFNDLIKLTIHLLQKNNKFKNKIINQYRYLLVDEFQDTSENNFKLLKLLLPLHKKNLFVVGDDCQSIYQFRNANVKLIINFKKYFKNVKKFTLKINYRSYKEIVNLSNKLILNNKYRIKKKLVSQKGKGGEIKFFPVKNFREQVAIIKKIISENLDENYKMAILYRNNLTGNKLRKYLNYESANMELMTIHSAKGLEFDEVIICDIIDGILPAPLNDIEEERRLFYVALTRAKKNLYLLYFTNKINFGKPLFISEIEK